MFGSEVITERREEIVKLGDCSEQKLIDNV
jgi:hypothetical protein